MKESPVIRNKWQLLVQLLFLAFFLIGFLQDRSQRWLVVFAIGTLASLAWGRFYCSWICPMNTLFLPLTWFERRLGRWRQKVPAAVRKPWLFVITLVLMVAISRLSGRAISPLAAAVLLAVVVTLVFEETFWHRYLCPYGSVLSLSARFSKRGSAVSKDLCIACGLCEKACPTSTISVDSRGIREIDTAHCLQCFRCHDVCPTQAIGYRRDTLD